MGFSWAVRRYNGYSEMSRRWCISMRDQLYVTLVAQVCSLKVDNTV